MTSSSDRGAFLRRTTFEFLLIVIGVLVALAVNQWQEERRERQFLVQQLESLVSEINANLDTIARTRDSALPVKLEALERVIATLEAPAPRIDDLPAFLGDFARSSWAITAWTTRNRFDALRSSGSFRVIGDAALEADLSDAYEATGTLLPQAERMGGGYAAAVHELIPARDQRELNNLRVYTREGVEAPVIADPQTPQATIDAILADRTRLLRLARGEVAVATGKWYALTRIQADYEDLKARLIAHPALQP